MLGVLSAGIDIASTDLMTLRPQYDGGTASDQTTHAGELRIRYRFWAVAGW